MTESVLTIAALLVLPQGSAMAMGKKPLCAAQAGTGRAQFSVSLAVYAPTDLSRPQDEGVVGDIYTTIDSVHPVVKGYKAGANNDVCLPIDDYAYVFHAKTNADFALCGASVQGDVDVETDPYIDDNFSCSLLPAQDYSRTQGTLDFSVSQ